mgnify:CR=1 FL=1
MTALTDHAKNLLARALCGRRPALPSGVWLGLGTGGSDASGPTRQPVSFTGTGMQRNAAAIRFTFSAAVGTLTHIGLFDAPSGGNPLTWSTLGTPATLNAPGTLTIPAESLTLLPD